MSKVDKPRETLSKPKAVPSLPKDPLSDFRNFLFLIWKHLNLPEPTRRQFAMASFLQHGPKRKMIQAWRGASKSWITCAYVCWRLYCDPQVNILVVSASKPKADEFTTFTKRLISEVPFLRHLLPQSKEQRWSTISYDVGPAEPDPNPSVKSAGITGQITGSRADEIVFDDVETPDNAATQSMRLKLAEKVKEAEAILKPLPGSRITFLGTPQTESSVYNGLPDRGYVVRIWPVRYPNQVQLAKYGDRIAPDLLEDLEANPELAGKSVEPSRFSEIDLAEREASYGRSGFALQFMLDTRLSDMDRYPLKLSDLVVMPLDLEHGPEKAIWGGTPEYVIDDIPNVGMDGDRYHRPITITNCQYFKYTGCVMAIDPSGRGKDETAYAVVAILNHQLFLLDAGGFASGYSTETLEGLSKLAQKYKVNKIIVEANFGDGMFTQLLKPTLVKFHPCSVEEIRHNKQKELRIIDTLEPVTSSHRLVVNESLVSKDFRSTSQYPGDRARYYQLFWQFCNITRDRGSLGQDDRLDALAMAVGYWTQHMAGDVDKSIKRAKDKWLDTQLKRHMQHVFGRKPEPLRFAG